MFAGMASQGYVPEAVNDKGYGSELADGVIVALGIGTSSEGSPAVDLNMSFRKKGSRYPAFVPEIDKTRHRVIWRYLLRDIVGDWLQLE